MGHRQSPITVGFEQDYLQNPTQTPHELMITLETSVPCLPTNTPYQHQYCSDTKRLPFECSANTISTTTKSKCTIIQDAHFTSDTKQTHSRCQYCCCHMACDSGASTSYSLCFLNMHPHHRQLPLQTQIARLAKQLH